MSAVILKPFWDITTTIFKDSSKRFIYSFEVIKTLVTSLNAFVISLFFLWVFLEFNSKMILTFIIPVLFFQDWVTVYGKSVYWHIWSWYAPLVFNLYFLKRFSQANVHDSAPRHYLILASVNFILIYIKCLMGYEFISTLLFMSAMPFVYYSFKLHRTTILKVGLFTLSVGTLGFFFAMATHYSYLSWEGYDAKEILKAIILKRTHAQDLSVIPEIYHASLKANVFIVLGRYLFLGGINQASLLLVSLAAFMYSLRYNIFKRDRKYLSVFVTAIVSLLGPISWYTIAKGHSHIHVLLNYVLWYLPTNYFIYIFLILTLEHFIQDCYNFHQKPGQIKK